MARVKNEYKFQVEGKDYSLKFDMNALAEMEEALDLTVPQIGQLALEGKFGVKLVRGLLWAGLLHSNPNLTIAEAGEILGELGLEEGAKVASEALVETLTAGKKKENVVPMGKAPKN